MTAVTPPPPPPAPPRPSSPRASYAATSKASKKQAAGTRFADPGVIHSKYFTVNLQGHTTPVGFFTSVSGVSLQVDAMEYAEGGQNGFVHKLPGRIKQGNITLKHGVVASETVLFKWVQTALGSIFGVNMSIDVNNYDGNTLQTWSFDRAYPVKWSASDLNAGGSEFLTQTLEIAYTGMQIL